MGMWGLVEPQERQVLCQLTAEHNVSIIPEIIGTLLGVKREEMQTLLCGEDNPWNGRYCYRNFCKKNLPQKVCSIHIWRMNVSCLVA